MLKRLNLLVDCHSKIFSGQLKGVRKWVMLVGRLRWIGIYNHTDGLVRSASVFHYAYFYPGCIGGAKNQGHRKDPRGKSNDGSRYDCQNSQWRTSWWDKHQCYSFIPNGKFLHDWPTKYLPTVQHQELAASSAPKDQFKMPNKKARLLMGAEGGEAANSTNNLTALRDRYVSWMSMLVVYASAVVLVLIPLQR